MLSKLKFLVMAFLVAATFALTAQHPVSAAQPLLGATVLPTVEPVVVGEIPPIQKPGHLNLTQPVVGDWQILPYPLPQPEPGDFIIIVIPDSEIARCGSNAETASCLQSFCDAQEAGDLTANGSSLTCTSK